MWQNFKKRAVTVLFDKNHRKGFLTSFAAGRNVLYSLGMFVVGLLNGSLILFVNGLYQLLLSLGRIFNLYSYSKSLREGKGLAHTGLWTGATILFLGLVYLVFNLFMLLFHEVAGTSYLGMLVTATLAFVKLGSSIWGFFANWRTSHPDMLNIRIISLMDAAVSLVTTQLVILTVEEGQTTALRSTPLFGMGVSLVFLATGTFLILRNSSKSKQKK